MQSPETIPFSAGALVVTSISAPNPVLRSLAEGCLKHGARFIVTGDTKSPSDYSLEGCEYLGVEDQKKLPFSYATLCPERSYTRKNIAYLLAIADKAAFIVETDDDNFPREEFWNDRNPQMEGDLTQTNGWTNAYSWFTGNFIYPRGFPLRDARAEAANQRDRSPGGASFCPIQQGLADENPDVDAVYRMLYPLPFNFEKANPLLLGKGQWCPFNSQNTTFFPMAYPLLYLPAHCSFRMTDIWRSFVAQRVGWEYGWRIAFHSATVYQERNEHNLLKDFEDEIPGYLENERIIETLDTLLLSADPALIGANLRKCYEALIGIGVVGAAELALIDAWLADLETLKAL
jgi:STELLO glycosyltransferases